MPTVNLNTRAEVPMEFRDVETGALVDPTMVKLKIQTPTLAITTYTYPDAQITKEGTGQYRTSILFNRPGKWIVYWEGTSSNEVSEQTVVHVNGSPFYDSEGDELPDS